MNISGSLSVASVSVIESGDAAKETVAASTEEIKSKVKDAVQVNVTPNVIEPGTIEKLAMLHSLYKGKA